MRILPVLDLKDGVVVRGVAGQREEYRPMVSQMCLSAEPLLVARAFRERFGLSELYVADLDAIAGRPPSFSLYDELLTNRFALWVDAGGDRGLDNIRRLAESPVETIIAGLESLNGPEQLRQILQALGPKRLVFSLDMKDGKPLADAAWQSDDPWSIACAALELGIRRILVLDLAAVGMREGTMTEEFCARLRIAYPDIEITTGGGVRGVADLTRLSLKGVSNVLVASALHDGRLTRSEIEALSA